MHRSAVKRRVWDAGSHSVQVNMADMGTVTSAGALVIARDIMN